jgi:hypothetical protein
MLCLARRFRVNNPADRNKRNHARCAEGEFGVQKKRKNMSNAADPIADKGGGERIYLESDASNM